MGLFDGLSGSDQKAVGKWGAFNDPLGLLAGSYKPDAELSDNERAMTDFIRSLTNQSTTLFNQSQPLRQQQLGIFGDVMSGKFDPSTSPLYAPIFSSAKNATEDQYNLARENVLAGTARGGAQTGSLSNVELARAGTMSSLPAQISQGLIQDMMGKAYGSVFPESGASAAQSAMSGFGTVAGIEQNRKMLDLQQEKGNSSGLGSLIGLVLKAFMA